MSKVVITNAARRRLDTMIETESGVGKSQHSDDWTTVPEHAESELWKLAKLAKKGRYSFYGMNGRYCFIIQKIAEEVYAIGIE